MKELLNVRMVENDDGEIDLLVDPGNFTGEHLDQLVRAIARVRPQFQPPVPESDGELLDQISVAPYPKWYAGNVFPQGLVLGMRHPGLGWAVFQIGADFPDQLQTAIAQVLAQSPSTSSPH